MNTTQNQLEGRSKAFSKQPKQLYAEAKDKLRNALIHDMALRYNKLGYLVGIKVGKNHFYQELIRGKVRIVLIGKEFVDYTVDEFINKYSF